VVYPINRADAERWLCEQTAGPVMAQEPARGQYGQMQGLFDRGRMIAVDYHGSAEQLTPVLRDPPSAAALVFVAAQALASPGQATELPAERSTVTRSQQTPLTHSQPP
jgi:hypothetical protein